MSELQRCLIVVVLYCNPADDAVTVRGLRSALESTPSLADAFPVLLWDNSPERLPQPVSLSFSFQYRHAAQNDGISGACRGAVAICIERNYEWILLLDQDTTVTATYLQGMLRHLAAVHAQQQIAAIVPSLIEGSHRLSPKRVRRYTEEPLPPMPPCVLDGEVFAANSGVLLRVSSLETVGGYSPDFWLDHSDMYVFHQFYIFGKQIFFASDVSLQHSMTMLDYDGRMTPGRYANFLQAEQAFLDLYKSADQHAVQFLRLLARTWKQRGYRNKVYSSMTWTFLLRRLASSKVQRLRAWRDSTLHRRATPALPAGRA